MATQQGVIKTFMASLDKTTLTGTEAVNEAVKACSDFGGVQAVINKMLADCKSYNNADSKNGWKNFLLEKCGINLDNLDTGAITGSDAGGSTSKTAESIVPESGSLKNFTGDSFTVNGLTVKLYKEGALSKQEAYIWQSIYTYWMKNGLNLIAESYGNNYSFSSESSATTKTLWILFENYGNMGGRMVTSGNPAYVQKTNNYIALGINMYYFQNVLGVNGDGDSIYLDRLIAHELTHAVMCANIDYYDFLPSFIKEGMAELTHGIGGNDYLENTVKMLAGDSTLLEKALVSDINMVNVSGRTDASYAGGYMFLRYLAKQAASQGKNVTNTKSNTTVTGTNQADTIENYGSKSKINALAGNDFIGSYAANSSVNAGDGNDRIELRGTGKYITLTGGKGNDTVSISGGTALIQYKTGEGNDSIVGFNASSTLKIGGGTGTYSSTTNGKNIIVTVGKGKITLQGAANLSKVNIVGKTVGKKITNNKNNASVIATNQADTIKNDGRKSKINALAGNDFIGSYAANSSVNAGVGNDTIQNTIYGTNTTLLGGAGNDSIRNSANAKIYGGAGADTITNTDLGSNSTLSGGAGNDYITSYNADKVSINGGDGNDTIFLFGSIATSKGVTITGGKGNDSLWGDNGANKFTYASGDGKDIIYGFDNTDMLKITGNFSTSYSKAKDEIYFKVGSTTKAITLSDFSATSFNVNGASYKISGSKLVKK